MYKFYSKFTLRQCVIRTSLNLIKTVDFRSQAKVNIEFNFYTINSKVDCPQKVEWLSFKPKYRQKYNNTSLLFDISVGLPNGF